MSKGSEVIRNPVNHILKLAAEQKFGEADESTHESVVEELARLRSAMGRMLPIERQSAKYMESAERELLRRLAIADAGLKYSKFKEFPMEALTWRSAKGFPRLALFSLNASRFELGVLRVNRRWSGASFRMVNTPELPREIKKLYKDVFTTLKEISREKRKTIRLAAEFVGVLPEVVREHIVNTKPLFKQLFVVAEVKNWDVKLEPTVTRRTDPLLVGWDGYRMWLLASFDVTPTEKFVEDLALKAS